MTQGLYAWSKTAASNSNADTSINWAEGQAPSSVNDSARAMMARTAEYRDDINGSITTGGTSTAYTATSNEVFTSTALMDKQTLTLTFHTTSGASPTLAVDGLTAKSLRISTGVAPPTGCFVSGTPYRFTYYDTAGEFLLHGAIPAAGAIGNSQLASAVAYTLKGNNTSGSAAPTDFTIDALTAKATPLAADEVPIWDAAGAAMKKATLSSLASAVASGNTMPTVQRFTSGSGTYTPAAGIVRIRVRMVAGGGGGGGATANSGTGGNNTIFGSWTAIGGSAGNPSSGQGGGGGSGGVAGSGTLVTRIPGGGGAAGGLSNVANVALGGGAGGNSVFGGGGTSGQGVAGGDAATNSGGGGGGGGGASATGSGSGGGAGEYVEFLMTSAQVGASQTYTVGATASGGAAGTTAGGKGAAGQIIVEEYYT